MALTAKQQAWVDYYKQGKTATEAARLAGYRGDNLEVIGSQNLAKLKEHVKERDKLLETPRIADMKEINEFWTSIIRSDEERTQDRLKASELRAKVAGAFVEKLEHSGGVNVGPFAGLTTDELRRLAGEDG